MDIEGKYTKLKEIIGGLPKALVAFSGGMDSTLLLKISVDLLGKKNVIAVTGKAPIIADETLKSARETAGLIGAEHLVVDTSVLTIEDFRKNPTERCYHCKRNLLEILFRVADGKRIPYVLEGTNFDDLRDDRPGMRAVGETGALSPLLQSKMTKADIRSLSGKLSLPTFNQLPDSCLATRVPYGTRIDEELLKRIELAEELIRGIGIAGVRVRCHGRIARIEVPEPEFPKILSEKQKVVEGLKRYGFLYIAIDLEGYKMGSMNETD